MPKQTYTVYTAPTTEPLSLDEAKAHCRIIGDDENDYLTSLISAARSHVETVTSRAVWTQTLRLTLDEFPACGVIELQRPPIQSLTSVTYVDYAGATQTLATTFYTSDILSEPARIVLNDGQSWPTTYVQPHPITVQFVAGWTAVTAPPVLKHVLRLLVGHWYAMREPVVVGTIVAKVPRTVEALLNQLSWGKY